MNALPLILTVFVACAVEAIEALTIVLAAGITREWKSTFQGMAVALVVLAAITAVVGPAIAYLPLTPLRLVIGALLAIFGLQWLRKAVLRATGYKALHDEASAYLREVTAAETAARESKRGVSDWYAFTLAFKGVLLEGLEVVFIVITFGANAEEHRRRRDRRGGRHRRDHHHRHRGPGAADQGPGELDEVRGRHHAHQLRHVLGRRGRGRRLAGQRRRPARARPGRGPRLGGLRLLAALPQGGRRRPGQAIGGSQLMNRIKAFGAFWYDFVIGDDWHVAALIVAGLGLTAILTHAAGVNAWWLLPLVAFAALGWSLLRATAARK